MNSIILYKLF